MPDASNLRRLLVVDPCDDCRRLLPGLREAGWAVDSCALETARERACDVGLLRLRPFHLERPETVKDLISRSGTEWIAVLSPDTLPVNGVGDFVCEWFFDFHTLPFDMARVQVTLGRAFGMARLRGRGTVPGEADEYDSAFFDKRSKFVHYRPRTAILNNLEFDHADIFPDLAAIERQFHHLVRTVPGEGLIIRPSAEKALERVLGMGCWTPVQTTGEGGQWQARLLAEDGSRFEVLFDGIVQGEVDWPLTGLHNVANALASLAAARHVGVMPSQGAAALSEFRNVKRRMEKVAEVRGVTLYDDFAHHPTAIATTLDGLRKQVGADTQVIAIVEPRSNSMKLGAHRDGLPDSVRQADQVLWYAPPNLGWDLAATAAQCAIPSQVCDTLEAIIEQVRQQARPGAQVVIMSNGGFGGLHGKLAAALAE
ncbi:UDP-N-acetylmuramate:L-alanyl-gamma-D-glutamyl-meso-diaminopimelate ligase [Pseudomonas aeruginosa]|nr:UDP-N-acetylmuramate:L-alanyl-gamma-D-glutamyl-meso-diaminopimelate ligase [Pseudomonas aeruginosa]